MRAVASKIIGTMNYWQAIQCHWLLTLMHCCSYVEASLSTWCGLIWLLVPPMLLDKAFPACLRVPLLQVQWRGHKAGCTPLTSGDGLAFLPVASLHSSRQCKPVASHSAVRRTRRLSTWEVGPLMKLFSQHIFIKGRKVGL